MMAMEGGESDLMGLELELELEQPSSVTVTLPPAVAKTVPCDIIQEAESMRTRPCRESLKDKD